MKFWITKILEKLEFINLNHLNYMLSKIKKKFKILPGHFWVLVVIICLGIFMRTYNFHAWLDFGSDQVNDANRVGAVVEGRASWPAYGPDMGNSGKGGRANRFRLGPIYYDFEIISAKMFGNSPVSMALPDLLFSILSLPLFYYFLRKIFAVNLSLALTGLYAISFYALSFSHSAWNVNSIPFFSLLFLTALYEFMLAKEETHWGWIIGLGVSLGVSVQLHAILLVLFPATLFFAWLLFLRKDRRIWKKMLVVILLMLILNLGQIAGERQNGFKNTKIFLDSVTGPSTKSEDNWLVRAFNDLSCNFQSNAYMLSAVGNGECNFLFGQITGESSANKLFRSKIFQPISIVKIIICLVFSFFGYGSLIYYFRKENQSKKRYFFGLIIVYVGLSFFVMLPILDSAIRYFVHLFFLPLILLGFLVEFLIEKVSQKYLVTVLTIVFLVIVASNLNSMYLQIKDDFVQSRIILGPVEEMVSYVIAGSNAQTEIYLYVDSSALDYLKSLRYIASQKGVALLKTGDKDVVPPGKAKFYLSIWGGSPALTQINGMSYADYRLFDQVAIFHLTD